ncbi:MAG: hypothetical protein V4603_12680 [Pseudomonadota bacterium]
MRLKFVVVTLVTGLLSSFTTAAVCPLPTEPEIPDGSAASGAEMLRAKKAMEVYLAELAKYLECDSSPIKKKRAEQQASAVNGLFEEQMKRYKEKS